MMTQKENEQLTQVGAGTPMGELLRRYWHPIAASAELNRWPTKAVRILGEDLVLYKDRSATLGLIGKACPHRRISLEYGIPEQHGLRCVYHGWLWDERGRCLEQPAEPPDSTYRDKVPNVAYPVQELGGLIFAYLGPEPVPLLPGWDLLVRNDLVKEITVQVLACNWLQVMENSMDPYHTEYLHAMQTLYYREHHGLPIDHAPGGEPMLRHKKIGFDVYKHGIIKRRVLEGQTEEDDAWKIGHPILFPNILKVGSGGRYNFQIRTPMDDTHTYHVAYHARHAQPGKEPTPPDQVPVRQAEVFDPATGRFKVETNRDLAQDTMAWVTQGPVMDRAQEHLAESDKGVILYRRVLLEQMAIVKNGGDPMNVFRDPAKSAYIEVQTEEAKYTARVAGDGRQVQFGAFGIYGEREMAGNTVDDE